MSSTGPKHKYFDKFVKLGYKALHELDTEWEYTEEPHSSRRKEILKKYPQLKKLMGYDVKIAYFVLTEVFLQLLMCYVIYKVDPGPLNLALCAYFIGGTINHSLGSAIHEIGHNLAFGHSRPLANRALGMIANLPYGVPMSITYKRYHSDHHRYLGHEQLDVDVPTVFESKMFRHPVTKFIWLIMHPLIHSLRPFYKSYKNPSVLEGVNTVVQLAFDCVIVALFGFKPLIYLVGGTLLGLGAHPLSAHFIAEHYLFVNGHATMSYYGPLNYLMLNLGYHIEHHDFPYIPGTRLPEVKRIAPEYYEHPSHSSWLKVLWDFVFDSNMGPHARSVGYLKKDVDDLVQNGEKRGVNLYPCDDEVRAYVNGTPLQTKSRHEVNGIVANGHSK